MNDYTEEQLDRLFFALSDQSRRSMLRQLSEGDANVSELGYPLGQSKQLVSKHLKVLENAGLITKQKDGRIQRCHFNPQALAQVQKVIEQYKVFWNKQFSALEDYIEQTKFKGENKNGK